MPVSNNSNIFASTDIAFLPFLLMILNEHPQPFRNGGLISAEVRLIAAEKSRE